MGKSVLLELIRMSYGGQLKFVWFVRKPGVFEGSIKYKISIFFQNLYESENGFFFNHFLTHTDFG